MGYGGRACGRRMCMRGVRKDDGSPLRCGRKEVGYYNPNFVVSGDVIRL